MTSEFNTIAIVGRFDDKRVAEPMSALARHLTKAGIDVVVGEDLGAGFLEMGIEFPKLDLKRIVLVQQIFIGCDVIP